MSLQQPINNCLLLASIMMIASCTPKESSTAVEQPTVAEEDSYRLSPSQYRSAGMKLEQLTMHTFQNVVKANGIIEAPPENHVSVNIYFSGFVKELKLITGERIKKGQVLFVLENPEYVQIQEDFLEAQEEMSYLKSDYERQKSLAKDNITSQKNYLKAKTDYMLVRIQYESLRKKLLFMKVNPTRLTYKTISTTIAVTSPVNGYITEINIIKGAFVNPSDRAMTIVNTEHLHLELKIFEKDLAKVAIGQPLQFTLQNDDSKTYPATVYLIHKNIDLKKRTIGIHGHLADDSSTHKFIPGMYVEARIRTSSEVKPALPQDAVVEADGKYYVLVKKTTSKQAYAFEKKEVEIGITRAGYTEILNANEFPKSTRFLVKGAFDLISE